MFLEADVQEQVDMMKEASDRFGSEKIYGWLPEDSYLQREGEYQVLGVSALIINGGGRAYPYGETEGQAENAGLPCFAALPSFKDMGGVSESLPPVLGCSRVQGAVLTLEETAMNTFMEIKQMLKREGIATDTFESSVEWKDFKLNSEGLIPVIVQDYKSREVLMMAYMNEEAFNATLNRAG